MTTPIKYGNELIELVLYMKTGQVHTFRRVTVLDDNDSVFSFKCAEVVRGTRLAVVRYLTFMKEDLAGLSRTPVEAPEG